jgi:hypothetical protein
VAHIFPWFYVQKMLKRPLWVGDKLPIQFFKKLTNKVFFSQIPKTKLITFFMKWGHKSWIARCISPSEYVLRVNRRLSKDSLCFEINPTFWQFYRFCRTHVCPWTWWANKIHIARLLQLSLLTRNVPHMPRNDKI